ncbi:hypothetical protein [Nocardioides alcanivorans]|uniref:hypothetical protein n=1 Tax=Nocardioides alcanivorans TaxID=2897352 RepID=UPI001F3FD0AE|nr:hypothetical protein [Nocardioides alcanivorans]
MESVDPVTEVSRDYSADLRAVMAAMLRSRPRHVRLVSANARSVRCVFSTESDGFHLGQQVTADLAPHEFGTRVRIVSGESHCVSGSRRRWVGSSMRWDGCWLSSADRIPEAAE